MKKRNQGFTLVEIMIVVAIIAILAGIAIPNFVSSRKRSQATACVANMRLIANAKEQFYINHPTETPSLQNLVGTDKDMKTTPICPAGGTYTLGDQNTDPTCSIGETLGTDYTHVLFAQQQANQQQGG